MDELLKHLTLAPVDKMKVTREAVDKMIEEKGYNG